MNHLLQRLEGGDRRSIVNSDQVVEDVLNDPSLFSLLFPGMFSDDPLIRMRSADAVEKITERHPEYLQPYKETLIEEVAKIDQQEVRWHVAQMLPRLELDHEERTAAINILLDYLRDESRIVKTFSLQALADFAEGDVSLRDRVTPLLEDAVETGSPAVRSRAQRLLKRFQKRSQAS
jgi:hypothetical protein